MGISSIIAIAPSGIPYFSGNYICPNGNNCHVFSKDAVVMKDPELISGFFSALMNMASLAGGEIQKVDFEKFRYFAHSAPNVIMIMITDINDEISDYQNRLLLSLDLFVSNFGGFLSNWSGNVAYFNAFQTILEDANIFDQEPTYRKNCLECNHNQDCSFRMVTGIQGVNIIEKMQKFQPYNLFGRLMIFLKETAKYIRQLKRFKKFNTEYKKRKAEVPTFKIVGML